MLSILPFFRFASNLQHECCSYGRYMVLEKQCQEKNAISYDTSWSANKKSTKPCFGTLPRTNFSANSSSMKIENWFAYFFLERVCFFMRRLVIFVRLRRILSRRIQYACCSLSWVQRLGLLLSPGVTRSARWMKLLSSPLFEPRSENFKVPYPDLSAVQLGSLVVREAVARAGVEAASIDECIMGNVVSAGLGQNPPVRLLSRAGCLPK